MFIYHVMEKQVIVSLLLHLALLQSINANELADKVAGFAANNGYNKVNLVVCKGQLELGLQVLKHLSSSNIYTQFWKLQDLLEATHSGKDEAAGLENVVNPKEHFIWILQRSEMEDESLLNRLFVQILAHNPVKSSIIVLDWTINWHDFWHQRNSNAHFHSFNTLEGTWHQIISIKGVEKTIANDISLKSINGKEILEEYHNLNGISITGSGIEFSKELLMNDCHPTTHECLSSGYLWDLITTLGTLMNFTVTGYREPSGQWGMSHMSEDSNVSISDFIGVMAKVAHQEHQIGLGLFNMFEHRLPFFGFATAWFKTDILLYMPEINTADPCFVLRPFSFSAWVAIALIALLLFTLNYVVGFIEEHYYTIDNSRRVMLLSIYIFFLLLHCYYSGALTMFNVEQQSVHFRTMDEAIDAYPTWKLLLPRTKIVTFTEMARKKNRAYYDLLKRFDANDEDTVVDNVGQGVVKVMNSRHVLYTSDLALKTLDRTVESRLNAVVTELGKRSIFILSSHNNPLLPSIQWGLLGMWETGNTRIIIENHSSRLSHSESYQGASPIGIENVQIVFYFMGAAIVLSALIFVIEKQLRS